jgi:hypothetical protein
MSLDKYSRLHDEDIRYLEAIKKINPAFRLSESMTKKLAKTYTDMQNNGQVRNRSVPVPSTQFASSTNENSYANDNSANFQLNNSSMQDNSINEEFPERNIQELIEDRINKEMEKVRAQQFSSKGIVQASLFWNIKFSNSRQDSQNKFYYNF